jgi:putative thioredoxin
MRRRRNPTWAASQDTVPIEVLRLFRFTALRYLNLNMADSQHIFDATPENFRQLVLENSRRGPVMVNYWAPWAGPCLKLWPVLEKLAQEYGGRFLLVNVNTEQHKQLARDFGVNSLPTVKVFRHERVVDEVHGAESERSFRALLERHVAHAADRAIAEAVRHYQDGERDTALQQLQRLANAQPDDRQLAVVLAKLLLREQRPREAQQVLERLNAADREQAETARLLAHARFMAAAAAAPDVTQLERRITDDPADLEARFALGAHHLARDDYQGAITALLEILRRSPDFDDGKARTGLVAIFNLLGSSHELTRRYRAAMLELLH